MKPKPNEYEVIILGSGLGGLIAGTLLSMQNHLVLLLMERGAKPHFEKEGYRFVPFSSLSEKNLRVELIQTISQRLGLPPMGDKRETRDEKGKKERVSFQLILPQSRIDLYPDWTLLKRELKREFPKEIFEIEKFYEELAKIRASLKGAKADEPLSFPLRVKSLLKNRFSFERSPFSIEFKKFLQLQLISYGSFYSDWFPISFLGFQLLKDETEELARQTDSEIFKDTILKRFLNSGGRVEEIEEVERVEMGWRRRLTLSLEEGGRQFYSNLLIFNSPLHRLAPLLGEKRKKILKFERRIQPRFILTPIFLGIQDRVIPVGMRDLLVSIFDLGKPFEGGNLLYLSLSPKEDEIMAPEGKRALTVEGLISIEKWNQGLFDEFKEGVLTHLKRLIPFLEDHLEFIEWEWGLEQVSRWSYPHYLYEATVDFNWRDGVVPIQMAKNLYFTGKENFPYLGLEGEALSGLKVGEEILKRFH